VLEVIAMCGDGLTVWWRRQKINQNWEIQA